MEHREEQLKIRIAEAFERVATELEKLNDRIDEGRWTPQINRDHESRK